MKSTLRSPCVQHFCRIFGIAQMQSAAALPQTTAPDQPRSASATHMPAFEMPCMTISLSVGDEQENQESQDYFDCTRDIDVADIRPHTAGRSMSGGSLARQVASDRRDDIRRTAAHHSGLLDSPRELYASSPELQELDRELHREMSALQHMGAADAVAAAMEGSHGVGAMAGAGGGWDEAERYPGPRTVCEPAQRQQGPLSLSGRSCAGSPMGRACGSGQAYAARYAQTRQKGVRHRDWIIMDALLSKQYEHSRCCCQ